MASDELQLLGMESGREGWRRGNGERECGLTGDGIRERGGGVGGGGGKLLLVECAEDERPRGKKSMVKESPML